MAEDGEERYQPPCNVVLYLYEKSMYFYIGNITIRQSFLCLHFTSPWPLLGFMINIEMNCKGVWITRIYSTHVDKLSFYHAFFSLSAHVNTSLTIARLLQVPNSNLVVPTPLSKSLSLGNSRHSETLHELFQCAPINRTSKTLEHLQTWGISPLMDPSGFALVL